MPFLTSFELCPWLNDLAVNFDSFSPTLLSFVALTIFVVLKNFIANSTFVYGLFSSGISDMKLYEPVS
jgi:hypothetical protein